jgi:hypothetical protein
MEASACARHECSWWDERKGCACLRIVPDGSNLRYADLALDKVPA